MKRILFLTLFALIAINAFTCDMAAMISEAGYNIAWRDSTYTGINGLDEQYDFIEFLENYSDSAGSNLDGYGLAYYKHEAVFGDTIYAEDLRYYDVCYELFPEAMDTMHDIIIADTSDVAIVMGHLRNGTGALGNHPFTLQLEDDDHVYTFIHNGGIQSDFQERERIFSFLDNVNWFNDYVSNWNGSPGSEEGWIDSELLFHFIMYHIRERGHIPGLGYDTFGGIKDAFLSNIFSEEYAFWEHFEGDQDNNIINFILSDGENIYAYKNSESDDEDHNLEYKYNENEHNWIIKTQHNSLYTQIATCDLIIFTPHGFLALEDDFFDEENIVSGTIRSSTDWDVNKYIFGNIYIPSGVTLSIEEDALCYLPYKMLVRGTLEIADGGSLELDMHSSVIVDTAGADLHFKYDSSLIGSVGGFYFECEPGTAIAGPYIPGDRVLILNEGKISTQVFSPLIDYDDIVIESNSAERWDGLYFYDINTTQILQNFDISGIEEIYFEGCGEERVYAYFMDVVIDDIGLFSADGSIPIKIVIEEESGCSLSNIDDGIYMYNNDIQIEDTDIENCYILNFTYASYDSTGTHIYRSDISDNDLNGLSVRDVNVVLDSVNIAENTKHGIYAIQGARFGGSSDVTLADNGWTEYYGYKETFVWSGQNWTIADASYLPTNFWDTFLLLSPNWVSGNPALDVSGNNIDQSDTGRFFPSYNAYYFGRDYQAIEEIYYAGVDAFLSNDYRDADLYMSQVVDNYPDDILARSALYYLFDICLKTDRNIEHFRNNLSEFEIIDNLSPVIEDLTIKSFMAEEEYMMAINRLEDVINNSEEDYIIETALLDEAYCYMKLSNSGSRNLPEYCRVKPRSHRDLIRISNQILSGHYEYSEPNPSMPQDITPLLTQEGNYPNPFNPETTISFNLAEEVPDVSLKVYNIKGQIVRELFNGNLEKGLHQIVWDGKTETGKQAGSGIYFYRIKADNIIETRKIMLIK